MEVITYRIDYNRPDVFYLYPFFDLHDGAKESSTHQLQLKIKECADRGKFGKAIGGGDWLESITSKDFRWRTNGIADWVEKRNIIDSERRHISELFKPIKEQNQLIAIGTGNHEEEIHKRHDDDIVRNLCRDFNVPYLGYQAFIILQFFRAKKHTHDLTIHTWHGSGSAQSEGARLMRLVRLVNDIEADIYLMGHLHAMTSHTPDRLVQRNGRIKSIKLAATICGSWLKTYNQAKDGEIQDPTYGEEKGYKPSRIGMPIIRITPDLYNEPHKDEFTIES